MALSPEVAKAFDSSRAESMLWLKTQFNQEAPADMKGALYAQRSISRYPNRVLGEMLNLCRSGLSLSLTDFQYLREVLVTEVGKEFPFRSIGKRPGGWGLDVVYLTDSVRSIVGSGEVWGEVLKHFTTNTYLPSQPKKRLDRKKIKAKLRELGHDGTWPELAALLGNGINANTIQSWFRRKSPASPLTRLSKIWCRYFPRASPKSRE